jgi:hypothetical protein
VAARLAAVAAASLAVASTAPVAGAASRSPLLVVRPAAPVVGKRVTIEVRPSARLQRLSAQLVSPTGVAMRVRLTRAKPHVWRAHVHFADDGTWTIAVRVHGRALRRRVFVEQPPAPMPPFKPWRLNAHTQSSLGASLASGGVVLPLPFP